MESIKICLIWHNLNSANFGVGALAISHLNMIVNVAKSNGVKISIDTVGTTDDPNLSVKKELEKRLKIEINHIEYGLRVIAKNIVTLQWKQINLFDNKYYDYIFDIGEGDSFADIYGIKRFIVLAISKWFAIKKGIPLIISPQTIGPFKHDISSLIANILLRKSSAVYVRDHKSSEYLKVKHIEHKEVSDVAFLLPFDPMPKIIDSVGLNISGLLWNGGYTKNNQFNLTIDYQKFAVEMINQFILRNKKIYLISHVITDKDEVEDDYRLSHLIKNQYFSTNVNVIIAPRFKSPIEVKSFISQMQFFVGSRMHATIGALSSGVTTIPIAYSRKFSGVFGSINYPYTLDAYSNIADKKLLSILMEHYDLKYEEMSIAREIAVDNAKQMLKSYTNYLKKIII